MSKARGRRGAGFAAVGTSGPNGAGYGLAIAAVVISTALAVVLGPIGREAPFLSFIPAVLLTLWYAGFRPALLATLLSALLADFFLIPPLYSLILDRSGLIKEGMFVATLGICSWLIDNRRKTGLREIELRDRLLDSSPQAIFITGLDHRVTYWNDGAAQLYGWSTEEATGKRPLEMLKTIYPALLEDIDREVARTHRWRGTLHRVAKDGREVITDSTWTLDQVTGTILQADLDITERVRAEELAHEAAAKMKAAIDNMNEAFVICDPQGKLLEHNQAYTKFMRFPEKSGPIASLQDAASAAEIFSANGEPLMMPQWPARRALAGETGNQVEYHLKRKDTGERWVGSYSFAPLRDRNGVIVAAVVNARDVTKAREMERELHRVNRALGAISRVNQLMMQSQEMTEEELYRKAVEVVASGSGYPLAWIGIPQQDAERTVRVAAYAGAGSEYARRVQVTWKDEPSGRGPTGRTLREGLPVAVQDYQQDLFFGPWQELAREFSFRSVLALPLKVGGQTVAALTVYSEDLAAFHQQETALLTEMADDLAFGVAAVRNRKAAADERTRRLQAEEQLQQAQKLEAIGTLAGGIAHDFNNLLMIIMAQVELLSQDLAGESAMRAEAVMKNARRAAELTGQLLAFSRKQISQPRVTTINAILHDFLPMTQRLLREDIEVRAKLCDAPWPVKIDPAHFEQVVMNLMVNARDAMPEGGRLMVETENVEIGEEYLKTHTLVPPGRYAMLAVSDTGVGMSAEVQARIFEPFFTTKAEGLGTGLGLAMVYGIVKQAGGWVWVYSEEGKGTAFKIYLPYAAGSEERAAETPRAADAVEERRASILVVEDDPDLRGIISDFLQDAGHAVMVAESPQEALRIAAEESHRIEVLLTDVVLKGGNGKYLAERLLEQHKGLQVVFMSGYTPNAIVHHGVLDAGVHFLQKPFSRAALLKKMREVSGKPAVQ